jgi:alpha-1,2-mannosyltransferase
VSLPAPCPRSAAAIPRRERQFLIVGGFVLSLAWFLVVYRPWDLADAFMIGAPIGRDFANFWAGGHLALTGRLDLLANFSAYNDFIAATFHHTSTDELVFSYPPHILPLLLPFGALPFVSSLLLWTALNLYLLERSVRLLGVEGDLAWRVAACLSPAAMTMVAYGHFGGVLAFLAVYALTRGDARPHLAGICLAVVSVKPQLAVSLGIFLLLTGRWRAVLWSLPATACLIGLSLVAFGVNPWINFVEWTVPFHAQTITDYAREAHKMRASVYAGARVAGLPAWAAYGLQYAFSIVVLAGSALLMVRQGLTPRTLALALFAVLAALPYFQNYDLAIITPALTVALFADQPGQNRPFLPIVPASLLWIAPTVGLSFGMLGVPAVPVVVAGSLIWALSGELRSRRRAIGEMGVHATDRVTSPDLLSRRASAL